MYIHSNEIKYYIKHCLFSFSFYHISRTKTKDHLLDLIICLNENEKRQCCLIYFICKYSEEDYSSRGELTDVISYK